MIGGTKEPYSVPIHEDGKVLTQEYLHNLEDAVKARTTLAGAGINIVRTNLGSTIALGNVTTCQILEFNVCSNGTPDTIALLAVVTKPGFDLYDTTLPASYAPIISSKA